MDDQNHFDRRVLVVEDDPATQRMLTTVLKRHGLSPDVVADGEMALQRLGSLEYDAILLDLLMPSINGLEFIRHLQSLKPDLLHRANVLTAASERTLKLLDAGAVAEVHACVSERSVS